VENRLKDSLNQKVFVPGGNGFLGQHVVKQLENQEIERLSLSYRNGVDFRDINQTSTLFEKEKFNSVINCAAFVGGIQFGYEKPAEIFYNNILMLTNLMHAAHFQLFLSCRFNQRF
jgi:GDP-L-fucose synthase